MTAPTVQSPSGETKLFRLSPVGMWCNNVVCANSVRRTRQQRCFHSSQLGFKEARLFQYQQCCFTVSHSASVETALFAGFSLGICPNNVVSMIPGRHLREQVCSRKCLNATRQW